MVHIKKEERKLRVAWFQSEIKSSKNNQSYSKQQKSKHTSRPCKENMDRNTIVLWNDGIPHDKSEGSILNKESVGLITVINYV